MGSKENSLDWSSFETDLITIPLFLVAEAAASTGLISMAMEACIDLDDGRPAQYNEILVNLYGTIGSF